MRNMHKYFLSALFIFFIFSGCDTDELQDLNINPQAVNEIDLNFMFSAAELSMASGGYSGDNRFIDWRTNIGLCGGAIQQLTTSGSISSNGNYYRHNFETAYAPWSFGYEDILKQCEEIINQTSEGGFSEGKHANMVAATHIIRVWQFQRLTDFYGNIPFTEANKGLEGNFFPAYDNQEDIYPALFTELAGAISALNASNPDDGFSSSDMIFQGDVEKWRRFGNTLMLRMAMRLSNVAPGLADQYVTQAMQNGGPMQSNDDNVWIPMAVGPSEWTNQNGISRAFYPGDGGNQSTLGQPLVDFLKGADPNSTADDDPRLMIYTAGKFDWTANDVTIIDDDPLNQKGAPPGYYQDEIEVDYGYQFIWDREFSRINYLLLDDDDPYRIMTHSEAAFLMAEALERGIGSGIPGTAEEHYNAGVRSAMQMWTPYDASLEVSDAEVDAYLAQYPYGGGGVTGSESNLEQIGWQMWASQYLYWYEAWSYWIRSAYPPLVQYTSDQGNVTGGIIPRRLQYPDTEIAINTNFNQASDNNYTSKVWWDVNPDN